MLFSYNNKNQNHTENTFSHIFSPAKQIYNFIPQFRNTNKTQEKKIIIRSNWEKKEEKEDDRFWGQGRLVLGCDDRDRGWQIWVRDQGRQIGAATAIAIGAKAKSNGEVEQRRRRVRFEVERRSGSRTALRSRFDLFLGAISLAGAWLAGGVCSLPLSSSSISLSLSSLSLSLFSGKLYLKVK